jgi:hypothetical protein
MKKKKLTPPPRVVAVFWMIFLRESLVMLNLRGKKYSSTPMRKG